MDLPCVGIRGPNMDGNWNLFLFTKDGVKIGASLSQAELIVLRNAINDHLNGKQA